MMRIYYNHSGREHWPYIILHRLLIHQFAMQFPSELQEDMLMIVNVGIGEIKKYYSDFDSSNKIVIALLDPYDWYKKSTDAILGKYQYNTVSLDKFPSYTFWGQYASNVFNSDYSEKEFPLKIEHLFLNYNRKPRRHRVDLINKLKEQDLAHRGIITLGVFEDKNRHPNTTILTIPENNNVIGAAVGDHNVGIPNDTLSIGDRTIWGKSFIILVGESDDYKLFITEKTFKPIMGKRPFIINGTPGTLALLHDYGFKTFSNFWDESYDNLTSTNDRHDAIINILTELSKLSTNQLTTMYHKMTDILTYNNHHLFHEFNYNNRNAFQQLGQRYMEYYY